MSKNLTQQGTLENPILLVLKKKTNNRLVNVTDGKIMGVTIVGQAYKLIPHKGNYVRAEKPFNCFYNWTLWDPFAGEVLDYEINELKKLRRELTFLLGKAGYIKLYEPRPLAPSELALVSTVVDPELTRGKEGECITSDNSPLEQTTEHNKTN